MNGSARPGGDEVDFVKGARDLARGRARAAFWLGRAGVAVVLSREIEQCAILRQAIAWLGERAVIHGEGRVWPANAAKMGVEVSPPLAFFKGTDS